MKTEKPKLTLTKAEIQKRIIDAKPKNWIATTYEKKAVTGIETWERRDDPTVCTIVLMSDDKATIALFFRIQTYEKKVSVDGTTAFLNAKGERRNFDRIGVDSSFSWAPAWCEAPFDPAGIIVKQIKDVEAAVERSKTSIPVPGIPFLVQPKGLEEMKAKLAAGKYIEFHPSGFGTGYRLIAKQPRNSRWMERGSKETCAFFDVDQLWIEKLDCD